MIHVQADVLNLNEADTNKKSAHERKVRSEEDESIHWLVSRHKSNQQLFWSEKRLAIVSLLALGFWTVGSDTMRHSVTSPWALEMCEKSSDTFSDIL